ncbi:Arylsulfatase [Pirellula sp. SH-Sr6A]|uniref:arylsulfatase n=1 Tax=Pirellula sp. SH-Sr6A TaxID=1632865 RepID=UPI00078EEE12|nr:arylsulfatase [Pirellula sp. SH-Sr6A]AMV32438.1 Arylsulfatase [Pirellula sp. SH-Sr6A]
MLRCWLVLSWIVVLAGVTIPLEANGRASGIADDRPNILLIVADDMGYSDLGCYGGEIRTPNIDALAARGLRATNFYVAPSCSPTRSMLLSGVDNHVAGLGNMAEWVGPDQRGKPGYEGFLHPRVTSVASYFRSAGYHTYMAGKWHLGDHRDQWPANKGFERDFSLLQGAGSHWSDMLGLLPSEPKVSYTRNGQPLEKVPTDYYSSKDLTEFIIQSIDEQGRDEKPFFAYLAYQAPHGPFAVPEEWKNRCKGRYDRGYDEIRQERSERQKKLGIVGKDVVTFPRLPNLPAWSSLTDEQKRLAAHKMELYAAMIEYMDWQIGRLLDHLKRTGKHDNTLIVFLSDNGAAGEDMTELVSTLAPEAKSWFDNTFDNRPENWGNPKSAIEYGPAWAQVSSVPFRLFKGVVADGEIRAPLIVAGPGIKHRGTVHHSVLHVMDLMPTFLELGGVPSSVASEPSGAAILQGRSMWPILAGNAPETRSQSDWLGWELFGNRAIRQGDWKLLYLLPAAGGTGEWQLYNLREDPAEMRDLSTVHPEKREALIKLWDEYVKKNHVIVSDAGPFARHAP